MGDLDEVRSESVSPISELTSKPPFGLEVADETLAVVVSPLRVDDVVLPGNEEHLCEFQSTIYHNETTASNYLLSQSYSQEHEQYWLSEVLCTACGDTNILLAFYCNQGK